jgi:acetoacetate decarboxylase
MMDRKGGAMAKIRYAARAADERRNRELEATSTPTWATSLEAFYRTDPGLVASVLPKPLTATDDPLVRINISTVDMGRGIPVFGAGTFAVSARHDGVEGYYPLVMPMTTEQAVVGGRETFGEPKKLADVTLDRSGDVVRGAFTRMGVTFVEIRARVVREMTPPPDGQRIDFYLKFLMDPAGKGFDSDPALVYCRRDEVIRKLEAVTGDVTLRESRFDPVADLPVREIVTMHLAERSSVQRGEIVARLDANDILPFVHQRYDDLSVTGK